MPSLKYHLLDVFTDQLFAGNPLAVFPDAPPLPDAVMQTIARELNLSETVFITTPEDPSCQYRLRIFTPAKELPMAGHPTIGAGYLLVHLGHVTVGTEPSRLLVEEGVGPIEVIFLPGSPLRIAMQQPMPRFGPVVGDRASIAACLSLSVDDLAPDLPIQTVATGGPFLFVPLRNLDAVGRARVRADLWDAQREKVGSDEIYVFCMETVNPDAHVHGRMFAPSMGIAEDPATGAANGPLGAYLVKHGRHDGGGIISEQGVEMGRPSRIEIDIDFSGRQFQRVQIAGTSVYVGDGTIHLLDDSL